jgi:alkanesulfonate monooxygenase SsuD/methylene tetrahydromethanopterin reductase-like flavin-dependent oxidoreductase (luciferase family)
MRKLAISSQDLARANIIGTAGQCVEKIGQYVDLGVTCFMLVFPEATKDLRCLEEFNEKVASQFN